MERLRDRMIQELRIRGMAERTVEAYVQNMRLMTRTRRMAQVERRSFCGSGEASEEAGG